MLLICGEIDLSVGHVYALTPLVLYKVAERGWGLWAGLVVGLAVAGLVGLTNGLITVYLKVPSLIVTLGMFSVLNGISLLISDGSQQTHADEPDVREDLRRGRLPHVLLGLRPHAGDALRAHDDALGTAHDRGRAATASVPARAASTSTGCASAASCSAASSVASEASSPPSTSARPIPLQGGTGLMFYGVAGAVIGGTALMGGSGTVLGAFIGVAVLTVLNNGFTLIGVDAFYNDLFIGIAILLSMALGYFIARARGRTAG